MARRSVTDAARNLPIRAVMKRLRAADLERGSVMAPWNQPADERVPDGDIADDVRQLRHRASYQRLRGHDAIADDLLREARALEAAVAQYQRAHADVTDQVADLKEEIAMCWQRIADDRSLHDLADDAGVLLALYADFDRAQFRLITLDLTKP